MSICRFLSKTISITSLFVVFSVCSAYAADKAVVSDDGVNLRAGNSIDSEIIGQYDEGQELDVIGYDGEWIKVGTSDGEAYLNAEYAVFKEANAYISRDDVNLRELPDTGSKVLGKFDSGDSVSVIGRGDNWYVIDYKGDERYIYADYVTGDYIDLVEKADIDETSADHEVSESIYAIVTSDTGLKLRSAASTEADVLYVMPQDDVMDVIEVEDEWAKVKLDDLVGYAKSDFINIRTGEKPYRSSYSSQGQEVVAYATQFVGNPYRWGGTSLTKGADCSGFALSVMKHFGVSLNRTSREQSHNGVAVDKSDLMPGDLVFFGYGSIGHVGIYIGDGQFVHAADERSGIIISSLSKRSDYYCARRVLR